MNTIAKRLIQQMLVAGALTMLLSSETSFSPSTSVINALYTVVGVASSLSISMTISLDFKEVIEPRARDKLKGNIRLLLNSLVCDFGIASLALLIATIKIPPLSINLPRLVLPFNIGVLSFILIAQSLVYNIRSIYAIYKFKTDLEDQIINKR